jgi:hypothetical protein
VNYFGSVDFAGELTVCQHSLQIAVQCGVAPGKKLVPVILTTADNESGSGLLERVSTTQVNFHYFLRF